MLEFILILFFLLVLAPIIGVLTYCGVKGTCKASEDDSESVQKS